MGRFTKHGEFDGKSATTRKLETKVLIMRNLIMLMLIQGPRFDAVEQAGVEYVGDSAPGSSLL